MADKPMTFYEWLMDLYEKNGYTALDFPAGEAYRKENYKECFVVDLHVGDFDFPAEVTPEQLHAHIDVVASKGGGSGKAHPLAHKAIDELYNQYNQTVGV